MGNVDRMRLLSCCLYWTAVVPHAIHIIACFPRYLELPSGAQSAGRSTDCPESGSSSSSFLSPSGMDSHRPRWYSLITTYNLHHLSEAMVMGSDSLVRIFRLDPGLLVGLWQVRLGPLHLSSVRTSVQACQSCLFAEGPSLPTAPQLRTHWLCLP